MYLSRLQDISLKWKLLIPFLFLAAMGAMALFLVSYRFEADLIHLNEEGRLRNQYDYFLKTIDLKTNVSSSLALLVANNPHVAEAFAKRDRKQLLEMLHPAYERLHRDYGVRQFHFHVPPATSFLRLHAPEDYGQHMESYRHTINRARETGTCVGGLEWGVFGFGIRSVAPVFFKGTQVGTVEFGLSFEKALLEEFKKSYGSDLTLYVRQESGADTPQVLSSTLDHALIDSEDFARVLDAGQVVFRTSRWGNRPVATVVGPVRDFSSQIVAVVEISADRSPTLALLKRYGTIAIAIALAGLVLSMSFVWLISAVFTERIEQVVDAAQEIAAGHRDTRIEVKGADEIGIMAKAINEMLTSLEESRLRIKVYADNLELMVEQRTRALKESEQSYRTLVENVPVIVYFVMADGTAIFVNRYVEEAIGVTPQQLSGHHETWAFYMHPNDRSRVTTSFEACLRDGKEFHEEYRMIHKDGRTVHVLDHAVPVFDNENRLVRMDGIVLDVTARKELQEKIVQAGELETLSQVSARLAHEIRNPLTSIGGLTRRLHKSFSAADPRRRKAELVVEEVERLEKILQMMTAYIEPKSIALRPCNLNAVVRKAARTIESQYGGKDFSVKYHLEETLGMVSLDRGLFERILVSLMENAYYRMNQKGDIEVVTGKNAGYATLVLAYKMPFISDDDIDHFFYPFVVEYPFPEKGSQKHFLDVPICKVLIHKHGGIINVSKEQEYTVKITISLPYKEKTD